MMWGWGFVVCPIKSAGGFSSRQMSGRANVDSRLTTKNSA